jgi:prepilin-type processing-associated H-X9-DG protein
MYQPFEAVWSGCAQLPRCHKRNALCGESTESPDGWRRFGPVFYLYPFMEQQSRYDAARAVYGTEGVYKANIAYYMGGAVQVPFYAGKINAFVCPSDPYASDVKPVTTTHTLYKNSTVCSYAASAGDVYPDPTDANTFRRSPFSLRNAKEFVKDFSSISDGLSNTIIFGERCVATSETFYGSSAASGSGESGATGVLRGSVVLKPVGTSTSSALFRKPINCFNSKAYQDNYVQASNVSKLGGFLGRAAWISHPGIVMFSTILPPNSPSCDFHTDHTWMTGGTLISASSFHNGGANTVFADGSVHFVSETVDSQTPGTAGLNEDIQNIINGASPFGIWGALGSCSAGDLGSL